MLTTLPVSEYAARLASREPAPGGGSAAALAGLLGAGLLEMTVRLSLDKKSAADLSDLKEKQAVLQRLHEELQLLVDRDGEAFAGVMAAYDLPQATEQEAARRSSALQAALRQAAEIPLETARLCLQVMELADSLYGKIDFCVLSDLGIGVQAGHTGVIGALYNTAINLPELEDDLLADRLKGELVRLRTAADDLLPRVQDKIHGQPVFSLMKD